MARRNSDVDVRETKKPRSGDGQTQKISENGQEKSDADVRKLGDSVTSSAVAVEADTCDIDMTTDLFLAVVDSATLKDNKSTQSEEKSTMHDLAEEVRRIILDQGSAEVADAFISAIELPPITLESLAELEMTRILNNPKLRQDVNFDRELHFRPNMDGPKGQQKIKQIDEYWKAVNAEVSMYARVQKELAGSTSAQKEAYWGKIQAESEKRLPNIFTTAKEIIFTLIPEHDHQIVKERLDAKLMMQEIKNGVCDLGNLADWLSALLKTHCAPMRDYLVDHMRNEMVQGYIDNNTETLVKGIRLLFGVLEAMKLDVANHQIRHMRPLLVADTVNFSRRYHAHRIATDKIDVVRSRNWLDYEMETIVLGGESTTHLDALCSALLRGLVLNLDWKKMFPQTFWLDAERLQYISQVLHMGIFHEVCREVLRDMTRRYSQKAFEQAAATLKERVDGIANATWVFLERVEYIAAEIMRLVLEMEGKSGYTDAALMAEVEARLDTDLNNPNSVMYEHLAMDAISRILPKLQASVGKHIRMGSIQLQDTFVPLPGPPPAPRFGIGARMRPAPPPPQPVDEDEDVVRRLTHIIVLHWQVWAELVYLAAPGDYADSDSSNGGPSPPSSRSASPTVPMAGAVYEPGHKFLPSGLTLHDVPSAEFTVADASSTDFTVTDTPSRRPTPANPSADDDAEQHHPSSNTTNHEQGDAQPKGHTVDPEQ